MVNDETKRKLSELTLDGLIDALGIQDENSALFTVMSFDERLEWLLMSYINSARI